MPLNTCRRDARRVAVSLAVAAVTVLAMSGAHAQSRKPLALVGGMLLTGATRSHRFTTPRY